MRYSVADLEDQILATIKADTTNFSGLKTLRTYAGEINWQTFQNPQKMQGFILLLPFVLVSYQGRTTQRTSSRSSTGDLYIHDVNFRIYVGDTNARQLQEAQRGAYNLLAAVYDDLHGTMPYSNPQRNPGITRILSGTAITTSEFNPQSTLLESGGEDERLVVSDAGICVYRTDYTIRMMA
jgi:glycogen debranching enzyme